MSVLKFALPLSMLLLAGCADDAPKDTEPGTPAEWRVRKIFEVEGCAVYQFRDWQPHYLTLCPGGVSSTQRNGKTTRTDEIPTVRRKDEL